MRAFILHASLAALLLGGCSTNSTMSLVVITVDADAQLADVATLHARATVGTTTREFDVHPNGGAALTIPPAQTFGLDIPHALDGTVTLHVDALDSTATVIASGDGSGPIRVGGRADVAIHLAAAAVVGDLGTSSNDMTSTVVDMAGPPGDMVVIPPAMLTIDKSTQSFGDIVIGKTSTTASFLVTNAGGLDSTVPVLTTGGANVSEFAIATDCAAALPPRGYCHVTASVTPTSAGAKTATFSLAAGSGGTVGGTVTANALTAGAVKIQQPSGNCGSSLVGTLSTTTASFTVQNSGASPTTALTVATSDPQFVASGCSGMVLAAGDTCSITVKFTPTSAGTQNASLTVSATTGGADTASLVGVGLKPAALAISPTSMTGFTKGQTATFTVTNSGDVASSALATATIGGTNAASFTIASDSCKGTTVGPSPASCMIAVKFAPTATGTQSATLSTSATTGGSLSVALGGPGLNPASLQISPTSMTGFTKGQTATFTVTNSGDVASSALATATIGGSNAASFTIAADHCKATTVGPAPASCTIDVKFAPTTTGTQSAMLSTSATTGGSLSVALGGPGLNPASLQLSPTQYTFATTARLSTTGPTTTFTVINNGDVTANVLPGAALGGNAGSFKLTDNCQGVALAGGVSCTVGVQFQPQISGTNSATLSFSGTTLSSTLSGIGTPVWVQEAGSLTLQPLNAVWAADANDVYAVGDSATIVYRDSTGTWSTKTLSGATGTPDLVSVSGNSSSDIYIAGAGIYHSNNSSTWTVWASGSFNTVFAAAPGDIWSSYYVLNGASATSAIYRYNATGWAPVTNSDGSQALGLQRVWGMSSSDMYVFGAAEMCGLGACSSTAEILHPDSGGTWSPQYSLNQAGPTLSVTSLWGFGKPLNNLYATLAGHMMPLHSSGDGNWTALGGSAPFGTSCIWGGDASHLWFGGQGLYAFDGTNWSAAVLTTITFNGIYGTGIGDVYAVGTDGSSGNGVIYHYY